MTDRDAFAAAALTGLIASREWPIDSEEAAHYCYRIADAMLRERGTPFQADCVAGNSPEIGCPPPVAETPPSQHVAETCRTTSHDAAPPEPPAAGVTLTDAEREAVRVARSHLQVASVEAWTLDERAQAERHAWALSCLLTRLGGDA